VRFLIDAQLPPAFAESFRREGHDGIPVRDVGLRDASDGQIWRYARAEGLVIVSKDEDFALRVRRSALLPASCGCESAMYRRVPSPSGSSRCSSESWSGSPQEKRSSRCAEITVAPRGAALGLR